jgi:hypothetical protein
LQIADCRLQIAGRSIGNSVIRMLDRQQRFENPQSAIRNPQSAMGLGAQL